MKKKNEHGGVRKGAGRKALEGTVKTSFRVTESYLDIAIKHYGKKVLNSRVDTLIQKLAINATSSE